MSAIIPYRYVIATILELNLAEDLSDVGGFAGYELQLAHQLHQPHIETFPRRRQHARPRFRTR